ncbi:hypothetical protein GZH53_07770 [Flavihumibacter sp. R14]|nr:hypothetical protein [Flavihumibacter soli]
MKTHIIAFATFLTVCTLVASTCKKDGLPAPQDVELNSPFKIPLNGKVLINSENIELRVSEITDSRCPKNVQCVWAGNAKVKLNVRRPEAPDKQYSFCIGQCETRYQKADTLQIEYEDKPYNLILTDVKPAPGTEQGTKSAVLILQMR